VEAIMGHSLQMNILRTGQTEVGGSIMNQVKQTAVVKAVREKKLMMNTRVMP